MKNIIIVFCLVASIFVTNCNKDRDSFYQLPENQEGEIYSQLKADPQFSTFVTAIDKVPGLTTLLNSSGLYTVFAPTNDAFNKYFETNGVYKSIDDMPLDVVTNLVNFHILQWMNFSYQFKAPGATKTQFDLFTYVTNAHTSYSAYDYASQRKLNIAYENKSVQVYTPGFFNFYGVTPADYAAVAGGGSSVSSEFNIMGASVVKADLASGNGVIHAIDRVLEVPLNINQELDNNPEYADYFNIIKKNKYVTFVADIAASQLQGNKGDVNNDGLLDTLWRRVYAFLPKIDYEGSSMYTAYIPTASAFNSYVNSKLLPGFNSINEVPYYTWSLLYLSHFSNGLKWPSNIQQGSVASILGDKISLNSNEINSIKILSNGLFYQVNKVIEPDAFLGVTGPVFLSPKYSYLALMLTQTGMLSSLTSKELSLTFLGADNNAFAKKKIYPDYSNPTSTPYPVFKITDPGASVARTMTPDEITDWVGNNIILASGNLADGLYDTYNGNKVEIKNGKINGASKDSIPSLQPGSQMSNGYFYASNMVIAPGSTAEKYLSTDPAYSAFYALILQVYPAFATSGYPFIDQLLGNKYTFLVPSNAAVAAALANGKIPTLPATTSPLYAAKFDTLTQVIRHHIIKKPIYTDGKVTGTFNTFRINKDLSTLFKEVNIPVKVSYSNGQLTITDMNNKSTSTTMSPINQFTKDGVIHTIDKVLEF